MEAFLQAQAEFRAARGLSKVRARPNKDYKRHGTKSYVHLLNRFGFEPTKPGPYVRVSTLRQRGMAHSHVAVGGRARVVSRLAKVTGAAAEGKQTREVTAEDQQNDPEYLCEVSIGTPAQKVLLDLDTGSSDLWIFSTELESALQAGHNVFDPSESSTFEKLQDATWRISYGDGSSASGGCGTDNVTIGGLTVEDQTVELASQLDARLARGSGDGLLGLGFPAIKSVKSAPPANMTTQADVPKESRLFTSAMYSGERDGDGDAAESFYTFGYVDEDLVRASGQEIAWTPVDSSQGFWMFSSAGASVNGEEVALADAGADNRAVADTGAALALVSDEVCDALYAAIPGAKYDAASQGYVFPLATRAGDLPEFRVAVGDALFAIQPEDLAFAPADDGDSWYGGVQSRGSNPFDILGGAFLKSIYAIWDQGNERFGAVPKIKKTQNLTPPATK